LICLISAGPVLSAALSLRGPATTINTANDTATVCGFTTCFPPRACEVRL
jgi:hypothetical protein